MRYANPYTPGAGFMPGYLAGREELLEDAEKYLNTYFTKQIANSSKKFIHKTSFKETAKDIVNKAQGL